MASKDSLASSKMFFTQYLELMKIILCQYLFSSYLDLYQYYSFILTALDRYRTAGEKKKFRKNIATEILMTNWGCNHSKWILVDAMHVKLPAWVIPVQWEKWNYTFKECQRRFNFDRNRNKPLLLAVVWDFEVLKFWKWIWIQSMELDKLQGNPWVVKISRGHFLCW